MTINRDYCVLNEDVTLLLSAAILDMLEPLCQLESRTGKWYVTTDIINVFSQFLLQKQHKFAFM